jgi:chemotaxis signal transduction protein
MQFAATHKAPHARTEQIILFRCSTQVFAISSASVQEVRSVDSLAGSPMEIDEPTLPKVRHMFRRGEQNLYVVNGAVHFGLRPSPASLIFLLRRSRSALLIDGIEKMTTMSRLQALPAAFCHEERVWYRGLTVLDQNVIPVVSPEGFLTADELFLLDALVSRIRVPESAALGEMSLGL